VRWGSICVVAVFAVLVVVAPLLAGPVAAADGPVVTDRQSSATGGPAVTDRANPATADPSAPSPNGTRIVHDGDTLVLAAGPGQVVRGLTDASPGTGLTVRVQSTDDDHPYLRSATTTVDADGAFRAVFDLSELPPGTPLRVVAHREGRNLTATAGEVVACQSCPAPMPDTPSALVLHDGGELTVENRSGQVVRGRTNLPPGAELTLQLRSSAGAAPFIKQTTATVDDNGTFRAVFGFEDIGQDVAFRVVVRYNGTELTTTRGRVVCRDGCEPTATPGDRTTPADRAVYEGAEVGVVQVANGSVARVRLRLGDADAAVLTVASPSTTYGLAATVRDGDGDGAVVVLFDTAAAGNGAPLSAAGDADGVAVRDERGRFVATDYRLALHPPGNDSTEVATGLLVVTQGGADTPLLTGTPDGDGAATLGSAIAIVAGIAVAVLGLGLLLGLVDPRALVDRF